MTVTLTTFKNFLRELTADIDPSLTLALASASNEVRHFLGFDPEDEFGISDIPSDIATATCLLGQCHADAGDPATNESRRVAAQRLLLPYRQDTGFGRAAIADNRA